MTTGMRGLGLLVVGVLVGCGGGGGGGGSPQPQPPVEPLQPALSASCQTNSVARWGSEPLQVGRAAEVQLLPCNGATLLNPRWTLSAPGSPQLQSARAFAVALEPSQSGTHRLGVSFSDSLGRNFSGELSLEAAPAAGPRNVLVRGEPSVWSGGQFSLRAWAQGYSAAELVGASWRWTQVDGPALTLDAGSGALLIAKAPTVTADAVVTLRATLTRADGTSADDSVRLLVQPAPAAAASPLFDSDNPASRVYPYLANGPQAAALARCVYNPALQSSGANLCTLAELPLLGQGAAVPTVEQVMQRVLVSNDWMGAAFERFLREQDASGDLRRMLAATTAVVIGGRVRPAFYWSATGAIYLDGAYLWLTPEQRDTLSEAPDPRSANGPLIQYTMPWRYVKDNQYATPARPVSARATRPLAEMGIELARLLYHELAHAGDFLPPASHASLDSTRPVYEAVPASTPSLRLQQQLPFFSQTMVELGRVLFFGLTATVQQNAYLPADIVGFFSTDRVTDDYAYALAPSATVPREDLAMLIEEAMMQMRYGIQRDVAISPRLQSGQSSADLLVTWGQRGRVGDAAIRPRLALVLGSVMPWVTQAEIDALPAPRALRSGLSWGQNLDLGAVSLNTPRRLRLEEREREHELARERQARVLAR